MKQAKHTTHRPDGRAVEVTIPQSDPAAEGARAARADVRRAARTSEVAELLERIAAQELGLETLETRNSDSLDFHDLSAASIKAALERAFIAGGMIGGLS